MAHGRPRDPRKEQQWRRWIRQWQTSGLTVWDFCARHALAVPSFYAWGRQLQRRDGATRLFVVVRVVPDEPLTPATSLEVVMAGGRRLRVTPGFDPATLRQLLAVLAYYGQLYELERRARDFSDAQRLQMRQDLAVPILERFRQWLEAQRREVLPKSPFAEAAGYALNNWAALVRCTEAGFLAIDNDAAEREMKRIAIGRKNWLFVGSPQGGQTAAVLIARTASAQATL